MWCRLALCVVLCGCGFHFSPAVAIGDPDGGAGNGSSGTTDCFQRWFDGPHLALSLPKELTALATANADTRDPWISADGLRLYFTRNPGSHGKQDVYLATRDSTAVAFMTASAVDNLDTLDNEGRVSLNRDETLLVLSSDHNTAGSKFQIFVSKRGDTSQPLPSPSAPDQPLVASVNTASDNYYDPFLTPDGLTLYLAPVLAGSPQQITRATRVGSQNFGPSTSVAGINSGKGDADPAVSPDERVIVFSSMRPAPSGSGLGATNLWYATRQSATDDFAAPQLIPMVNSNSDDGDPVLSADGCELYFASKRVGGKYQLFHAEVMQ